MGTRDRWWLNPGETIWAGDGTASATFSWDDGGMWGIKVQLQDSAHDCHWDYDARTIQRHPRVPSDLVPAMSRALMERMPRPWGQLDRAERGVLDTLAARLESERWVLGRVVRHSLSKIEKDRWDRLVRPLFPRYLATHPDDDDIYALTLPGLLATSQAGRYSAFYEAVLGWLHKALDANPAMTRIRAGDVIEASGWEEDLPHVRLAYHLLLIAGWVGGGQAPSDRAHFDLEVPDDLESLAKCSTFSSYLEYLRKGTSGRPWPTVPALLPTERPKSDARDESPVTEGAQERPRVEAATASPSEAKPKMPKVFETTFETYRSKRVIGQGGNGFVHEVQDENGATHALKVLSPEAARKTEKVKRFRNEFAFCKKCDDPGIVKILDAGFAFYGELKLPFYVMPLYAGTLRDAIGTAELRKRAAERFIAILEAVDFAHSSKVIHRDLKPENILYDRDSDRYVLADFGIAHFAEEQLATSIETRDKARMANHLYAAPEQRRPGRRPVDHRADLYAVGLMINEVFTDEVPQGVGFAQVAGVEPDAGYLDGIVNKLIEHDPDQRLPSAAEAIRLIEAGASVELAEERGKPPMPPDPRYSGVELAVLDLLVQEAANNPRAILGSKGIIESLPEYDASEVTEALELLGSDFLLELHRSTGGFHIRVLAAAWFHRASAIAGADPERDLTRILQILREGDANGPELLEKLGGTVAGVVFALDEAESLGHVQLVTVMGGGVSGIAAVSITPQGKRALREAGA